MMSRSMLVRVCLGESLNLTPSISIINRQSSPLADEYQTVLESTGRCSQLSMSQLLYSMAAIASHRAHGHNGVGTARLLLILPV